MTSPDSTSRPVARPRGRAFLARQAALRSVHRWRALTQLSVAVLVVVVAVRHASNHATSASVDAVCPFGAVETLYTWLTTGSFIPKTTPANLAVGLALLVSVLLAGNAFCGWVCPFGAAQDALAWLRRKLKLPSITLTGRVDRIARLGRFVVLALILIQTASTVRLWFAGWDPFVTMFSLHWLFEPDPATMWGAWVILGVVLIASVVIERAWCRYLCPLGGLLSVLGRFSILKIRRSATACTGCNLCVSPCPMGIDVALADPAVSSDCIGCLECVASCPSGGALEVAAAAPWRRTALPTPTVRVPEKSR